MDKNQYKKLAEQSLQYAIANGCQQARAELNYVDNFNLETRNGAIETLQQSTSVGLTLRLMSDGKYGSYSTNRLDLQEVRDFIDQGIATTRYLGSDPARTLPDPSRYYRNDTPIDLGNNDPAVADYPLDDKISLALGTSEALGIDDPKIIAVEINLQDRSGWQYITDSQGFRGETSASICSLSAAVTLQGDHETRPSGYRGEMAVGYASLPTQGIALKAYHNALQKLGQKKIASGSYTLIVEPRKAGKLIDPLMDVLYGSSIYRKRSFLADKKDCLIASPILNMSDRPHQKGALGACLFDFEGVATQNHEIIREGRLVDFFIDTYYAHKLGVEPTFSGPAVLCIEPGSRSREEIVAAQECAIYITGFNGGNYNEVTGDYSFGIEGVLVEQGKFTTPVFEMNMTGNLLTLWQNLTEIGSDTEQTATGYISTLVFKEVICNGE